MEKILAMMVAVFSRRRNDQGPHTSLAGVRWNDESSFKADRYTIRRRQMKTGLQAMLIPAIVLFGAVVAQAENAKWEVVSIPGICTYQIPPTVEIQKGLYKKANDQFRGAVLEIVTSPNRVVAQPKGINDLDPEALKRYCRIIVETERGSKGDYARLGEPLAVSEAELVELDGQLRKQMEQAAALSTSKGMKMSILSWQPAKIVRVSGVDALRATYTRTINDAPAVIVQMYTIQNNDAMHKITISYRESEKDRWAGDLERVLDTFKFKKR